MARGLCADLAEKVASVKNTKAGTWLAAGRPSRAARLEVEEGAGDEFRGTWVLGVIVEPPNPLGQAAVQS